MSNSTSNAEYARTSLAECLNRALAALDGFPIGHLLDVYVAALEGGSTPPERAAALIDCIFESWISGLRAEIEILTPASTELMVTTRQQLADTQGALVGLQTQFRNFERCRIQVPVARGPFPRSLERRAAGATAGPPIS